MANMKYLLNCRNFISLMVLFSFFDNFGMKKDDYIFKVVFVGDATVGKTQIKSRYVQDIFDNNYNPTIGLEFEVKEVEIDNKKIKLQLWDTAGQEKFRSITRTYYKSAHLIVFVYAIDNKNSFDNIQSWVNEVNANTNKNPIFWLVGNKCDLEENKRKVSTEEAKNYAEEKNIKFIEVSAKDGTNIEIMFNSIIQELLEDMKKEEKKFIENNSEFNNHKIINLQDDNNSQKKYHINKKDLPFCDKYCFCCPCLEKSEGDVEEQ